MVTACAAVLNGLLSRYGAINDRLRALAHERLDLLDGCALVIADAQPLARERLVEIDTQAPALMRRHRSVRDCVLLMYAAIVIFIACMFVIALAAVSTSRAVSIAALVIFLLGTTTMMVAAA